MSDPTPSTFKRDARIIGLVGSAHFFSHFFQLTLPPLFPLLKDAFGVPYVALGFMMSVMYAASGIGQTVSGFLVDRFGAARVLAGGMALFAGAIAAAGLAPSYWALVPIAVLAGLGNSVFHPADYSIFNASVSARRLGRAYSVHSVGGSLGWTVAPAVIVALTAQFSWRVALVTVGMVGVLVALLLSTQRAVLTHDAAPVPREGAPEGGLAADIRLLFVAPVLAAFAYFALLATSLIGIQTFSVSALVALYGAPLGLATGALTAFLLGTAGGVVLGGFLADHTRRHDFVAATGMASGALLALLLASGALALGALPVVMALGGFALGVTSPSRDMLVRAATPRGASGKVYGFVYSGLDLGSALTPLMFGWLLDRGEPRAVFVVSAVFMLLTITTVVQVRRHGVRPVPSAV
ncbi:MAG TPA: MFS transporter [Methylomirabilota bacterium]|nr:MFS transporter [Methylomirabilota bacterium]